MMNTLLLRRNSLYNFLQTVLVLLALTSITALMGWLIAGGNGVVVATAATVFMLIGAPQISSAYILRTVRARPLERHRFPRLHALSAEIARRAGLAAAPKLYVMPSRAMNAFALKSRDEASIVVSDSLLRNLNLREMAGILGHETAHIRNGDLYVMVMADMAARLTIVLSMVGQVLLILALPALLATGIHLSIIPLLVLVLAPAVTVLLQLALSRIREYQADADGVQLAGDVYGLISALRKLDRQQSVFWRQLLPRPWSRSQPSLLQTHPPTPTRIERLLGLQQPHHQSLLYNAGNQGSRPVIF